MESLKHKNKVVGIKQTLGVLASGKAMEVYIAKDSDKSLIEPVEKECERLKIKPFYIETRKELGKYCGLQVPAAVAATVAD